MLDKDTPIIMSNGSFKAVKDLQTGDKILSMDSTSAELVEDVVEEIRADKSIGNISLRYSDKRIICTGEQPFVCSDGSWVARRSGKANYYYSDISKIARLDETHKLIFYDDGWKLAEKIFLLFLETFDVMYSIVNTKNNNPFFANGLITISESKREEGKKVHSMRKRKVIMPITF